MKAYGLDLRERIVSFVNAGGSKVEAATSSVYMNLPCGRRPA